MQARIYQPAKTAVQSGRARTRYWVLEIEPRGRKEPDPLIGWVGGGDTAEQVRLRFPSKEAAIAHARRKGIPYEVHEPRLRLVRPQSYSDNFIRPV